MNLLGRIRSKLYPFYAHALERFGLYPSRLFEGKRFQYRFDTDTGQKLFWMKNGPEWKELAIVKKYLTEESVIIDIGANVGTHSVVFANKAKNGSVIAIEPSREVYPILLKNSAHSNIIPLQLAISDKNGRAVFNVASDDGYSGLKNNGVKPIIDTYEVLSLSLDTLMTMLDLPCLDLIKIDVEGLENEVLVGAAETIRTHTPFIFCEINGENHSPDETIRKIESFGYRTYVFKTTSGKEMALEPYVSYDKTFYNHFFIPKERMVL
jgi:FkbM family methyltransferase